MNMDEYQKLALRTARDPNKPNELFHLVLGLMGESGEIAEKVKKIIRDQESDFSKLDKTAIKKELGDVLWYVAVLAEFLGISMEEVAQYNIEKLASRLDRGTIGGSGDDR